MGAADLSDVKESWEIFAADLQMLYRMRKGTFIIERTNKT